MTFEDDVVNLKNSCNMDKEARKICSTKTFWKKLYDKKSLKLPPINYTNPENWLVDYEKELLIKHKMNRIISVLKNPTVNDFEGDAHPLEIQKLFIYSDDTPFNLFKNLKLFKDKNDYEVIIEWYKWLLLKNIPDIVPPQIIIDYKNNYHLNFQYSYPMDVLSKNIEWIFDKKDIDYFYEILYIIVSSGSTIMNSEEYKLKF